MPRNLTFQQLTEQLLRAGSGMEQFVKDEIEAAGREIEVKAKGRAPVDLGALRRSINYSKVNGGFGALISVNVSYGAYQEFGTGGLVNVPTEMRELAEHYKGKGVKQINLRPQPFLYPSFVEERQRLIEKLKRKLRTLL